MSSGICAERCGSVLAARFRGTYIDANAISPQHKRSIAERMEPRGVQFVDGGIIGLPPRARGQTWLYLSGAEAEQVACCFTGGPMECEVIGTEPGKASALKMCFAAQSKGSTALLCAVLGAAQQMGVLEDLKRQWTRMTARRLPTWKGTSCGRRRKPGAASAKCTRSLRRSMPRDAAGVSPGRRGDLRNAARVQKRGWRDARRRASRMLCARRRSYEDRSRPLPRGCGRCGAGRRHLSRPRLRWRAGAVHHDGSATFRRSR